MYNTIIGARPDSCRWLRPEPPAPDEEVHISDIDGQSNAIRVRNIKCTYEKQNLMETSVNIIIKKQQYDGTSLAAFLS
jgi:hypothetical protein